MPKKISSHDQRSYRYHINIRNQRRPGWKRLRHYRQRTHIQENCKWWQIIHATGSGSIAMNSKSEHLHHRNRTNKNQDRGPKDKDHCCAYVCTLAIMKPSVGKHLGAWSAAKITSQKPASNTKIKMWHMCKLWRRAPNQLKGMQIFPL